MMIIIMMLVGCSLMSLFLEIEVMAFLIVLGFMFTEVSMGFGTKLVMLMGGLGSDMVSYSMILLSLLIGVLMLLGETKITDYYKNIKFKSLTLSLIFFLVLSFISMNMLMFYLFFEMVLVPSILLIMSYGYQPERLESGVYSLSYTVFGSLPLLLGIFMLKGESMGSYSMFYLLMMEKTLMEGWGLLLLLGFLVKMPMYGLHLWLPKAHVEASVGGSMILAGVLLKLGCYGMYRFYFLMKLNLMLENFFIVSGIWGAVLSGLMCLRQLDSKKLVAYSSVVHSGLFLGGMMIMSGSGVLGGLIMMIGHGVCSSGLFYSVNMVYERLNSRSILISKGSLVCSPFVMMWMFLLSMGNMGTPPFMNFFSEIFLSMGVLSGSLEFMYLFFLLFFISVGYGIYFYSVLSHGEFYNNFLKNVSVSEFQSLFMHFWPTIMSVFVLDMLMF